VGRAADERVSALDGMRAVAVIVVVVFHAGLSWLPGGFLGVDVFFVLSGYLITGLLLEEVDRTGRIDLWAFWARRARRLLPAFIVLVVVVSAVSPLVLPAAETALVRDDALSALAYVANWRMILRGTDYFAQTAAPSPLQHTWSLAIEERASPAAKDTGSTTTSKLIFNRVWTPSKSPTSQFVVTPTRATRQTNP
jgi:peptidoglycan/LPS O-acetylase OafA/YrhL